MKKLQNPYASLPGYFCFGCSPDNDHGLQMEFYEEDGAIVSTWDPKTYFQGYINILHGGIQSTLIDEIASWVVFVKLGSAGVTSRLNVRFKKPVQIDHGPIRLRAVLREKRRRIAMIDVSLFDGRGQCCAEGAVDYYVFDSATAGEQMKYPGKQAFYPEQ
jgi:uncharacterized protein (TIGR00369 family)